jgi:hypothetical protein
MFAISLFGTTGFRCRQREIIYPLISVSRLALRSTQPSIELVLVVLIAVGKHGRSMTLTIHPIQCRGQEWAWAIFISPLAPIWRSGTALCFRSVHDGEVDSQLVFFLSPISLRGEVNSQNNWNWSSENSRTSCSCLMFGVRHVHAG